MPDIRKNYMTDKYNKWITALETNGVKRVLDKNRVKLLKLFNSYAARAVDSVNQVFFEAFTRMCSNYKIVP